MNKENILIIFIIGLLSSSMMFAGLIKVENPDKLMFRVVLLDLNNNESYPIDIESTRIKDEEEDPNSKSYHRVKIIGEEDIVKEDFAEPINVNPVPIGSSYGIHNEKWHLSSNKDSKGNITITVKKRKTANSP